MTKQELIEALERLTTDAAKAGLSDAIIIDAFENVLRALQAYPRRP